MENVTMQSSLLNCKQSKPREIMLLIVDDGLSLELRHFSPFLRPGYFKCNEKFMVRQYSANRHLGRVQQRCSCSVPSSPNFNAYLRHGTNTTQVQHNCIRYYITYTQIANMRLGDVNTNTLKLHELKSINAPQHNSFNETGNHSLNVQGTFSVNLPLNKNQNTVDTIPKTCNYNNSPENTYYEKKLTKVATIEANDNLSLKVLNQLVPFLGNCSFCKTFVRQLHTNVRSPCKPSKINSKTKECPCCPDHFGTSATNTELSEDARKLLNDLNINQQQDTVVGISADGKRYKKSPIAQKIDVSAIKDRMRRCKGIRGRKSLDPISTQNDYEVVSKFNEKKTKPFSTDSRLWNNYVQSNEDVRVLNEKWQTMCRQIGNGMSIDNYFLVTKNKQSFFRDLANNFLKLFGHGYQPNDHHKSKFVTWYNNEPEVKSRYDFTIKHDYKTNKIENQFTIKRKDNLDMNKNNEVADKNNCETEFERRSDNIKLYNSVMNLKSDVSRKSEVMKRFARVMKKVMRDMDNVVVKDNMVHNVCKENQTNTESVGNESSPTNDLKKTMSKENQTNTESVGNESSPTNDLKKTMRNPEKLYLDQCKLYSIKDQPAFKDTCLHVKIKPLMKSSKFTDIQIDDMKVEVVDLKRNNSDCSSNYNSDSSSDRLNLNQTKPNKCLLLNMTLILPFSSKDFPE